MKINNEDQSATVAWSPDPSSSAKRASGPGFPPGAVLAGRYRVDTYLAAGGMGQVYRAHDLDLDVPLALKTIRPEIASNPTSLRRFKQELLLARSVTHPNVCRIFDLVRDGATGVSFLTMEFLEGETLSSRIDGSGALDPYESLPLVRQMSDALDAAHRAGIVHRDFKSPNVMLVPTGGEDRTVILDFGLAVTVGDGDGTGQAVQLEQAPTKTPEASTTEASANSTPEDPIVSPAEASSEAALPETEAWDGPGPFEAPGWRVAAGPAAGSPLTSGSRTSGFRTGGIVGTPAYMSPEQVAGRPVGPASDLYALGVVLFEMCTGQLPFRGSTPLETARAHLTLVPPRPGAVATVSEAWERTILRLLAKEPRDRYATAHDAVLALEGRSNGKQVASHSLPAERDAFVGRATELEALAAHLEGDLHGSQSELRDGSRSGPQTGPAETSALDPGTATRLFSLQGTGGTGKTRLAQKYGWDSLLRWPGGVWFCDLSEARSVLGIASAVATALNVPLSGEDPIVQLGHAIAGRGKSLIILDNFEQVVVHAEMTLGRWLERATEARFLVTSRERLRLPEETIYELEPLDPTTRGVELFEVRAWGHRPGFLVEASNQSQVQEIVQKLDGLPLAIELAASRLRMLSLEKLREGLEDQFRVLAGGKRGRHETLQATLDWSWNLLQPWEKSAIAQASVFEGGFTLDAAETVVEVSEHADAIDVLDIIHSLVDKSWLRAKTSLGALRSEMYPTVQEYASQQLRAEGLGTLGDSSSGRASVSAAQARHGDYYARMGTTESLEVLSRHGGLAKRSVLVLELGNLLVACRRAIALGNMETATAAYLATHSVLLLRGPIAASIGLGLEVLTEVDDPVCRGRTLLALAEAERVSGTAEESRKHAEEAIALCRRLGDRIGESKVLTELGHLDREQGRMEEARRHYEEALSIHRDNGNHGPEGQILGHLGVFNHEQGHLLEAGEYDEAALLILGEVGDRRSEGVVRGNLGSVRRDQGRLEDARNHFEAARVTLGEVGDRRGEGNLLINLGLLAQSQGRMESAREHYEEALAINREVGDCYSQVYALFNLGNLHREQGRMDDAREHLELGLAESREGRDRRAEGGALFYLGSLHYDQGRLEEACEYFEMTLTVMRELGDLRSAGSVLGNLGAVHQRQGRMKAARERFEEALAIHREVGNRRGEGSTLGNLSILHAEEGRLNMAREHYLESLAILRETGDRSGEGQLLGNLGNLDFKQGRLVEAREHYDASLEILRELVELRSVGLVLINSGRLHTSQGQTEEARLCFEESIAILRDLEDPSQLGDVLCLLGLIDLQQSNLPAARAALAEAESTAKELAMTPESELARQIEKLRKGLAKASDCYRYRGGEHGKATGPTDQEGTGQGSPSKA